MNIKKFWEDHKYDIIGYAMIIAGVGVGIGVGIKIVKNLDAAAKLAEEFKDIIPEVEDAYEFGGGTGLDLFINGVNLDDMGKLGEKLFDCGFIPDGIKLIVEGNIRA